MSNISARSGDEEKSAFLSGAIALLVPIDWPEPFGLVMIEAMACGTPVIAFNRGSVPEVIDDGLTGFIVEDEIGAIGAVDRLGAIVARENPRAVRGALHRAAHGAGLSRRLSQPDREPGAAPAAGRRRRARRCRRSLSDGDARASMPAGRSSLGGRVSGISEPQRPPSRRPRSPARPRKAERAAEVIADVAGEASRSATRRSPVAVPTMP